ncbi:MAG: carboxypeptidase-like regulatory domain-containing protein [Solirubrobacteraceae bacterium]
MGRGARRPALVVVAAVWCLVAPPLAQAGAIVQLPNKVPAAFNAQDEVLSVDGHLWVNPTTVLGPPTAPASDPTATFKPTLVGGATELLNDSGVVAGTVTTGTGATVPGYWDSAHSTTFTEVSLSGLTVCGQPATSGALLGVDASGEAVGQIGNNLTNPCYGEAGLYVPAVGGLPAGPPQVVSTIGGVAINSLYGIGAAYEAGVEGPAGGGGGYSQEPLLIARAAQTATPIDFGVGIQPWSPNGNMAGATTGGNGALFLRHADGSETPLAGGGGVVGVNDAGYTIGETNCSSLSQCTNLEWSPTGAVTAIQSEVPAGSGWTIGTVAAINAQGDIVGNGTINGQKAGFLLKAGATVSGTVSGDQCSDTSCTQSGLPGVTIIVTGSPTAGGTVTQSAVTAADGTWSVTVPAGTYSVGPSRDGKTIDGTGFDPLQRDGVVVPATGQVGGQDFQTCALDGPVGSAGDFSAASDALASPGPLAFAAAAPAPSPCKSIYTVTVSAKIPQPHLVDPSPDAPYELATGGGFNPSSSRFFRISRGYPECLSAATVTKYNSERAKAEWYTYIVGGPLGSVTVSYEWNRTTGEVYVVDEPSETNVPLTRKFVYRITEPNGTVIPGSCDETHYVPMLVLPVGGADYHSTLSPREFSLIVVWGFPFEPQGVRVDPNTLYEQGKHLLLAPIRAYDHAIESLVGTLVPHAPHLVRAGLEFGASYLLGTGFIKAVEASPVLLTGLFKTATYLPQVLAGVEEAAHLLHKGHNLNSFREAVGTLAGLALNSEYPVMGAIVRGHFEVSGYQQTGVVNPATGQPEEIPLDSMLGLSIATTKFPTISVQVSRSALANDDPNNKVTSGPQPLPWASMSSRQLDISNTLSGNPPYLVTNAAASHYSDGLHGVHQIHANTSQLPALEAAVHDHAEEASDFVAEVTEAKLPSCGAFTALPAVGTTICFKFNDGRP